MAGKKRREMTIEKVQQWIVSALICAVASFPIGALVVTSVYMNRDGARADAMILCMMAAVIGTLAVGAGRLMHRLHPMSWFVLIGAVPGVIAIILIVGS
jgi:hypothetical protein